MSELIDCIDGLTAEDIIRSVAKTANGLPWYLQTSGSGGFCSEYQRIYNDLAGSGTPPGDAVAAEQNTMVCGLVDDGVWAKLDVFYLYAQTTNAASEALMNWVSTGLFNAVAIHAPPFVALEGFQGDGTNDYINCNWNPHDDGVNYVLDSASAGCYIRTDANEAKTDFGIIDGADVTLLGSRNGGLCYARINTAGAGSIANADARGMYIMNRTANNVNDCYKNGALFIDDTDASSAVPDLDMYVLGRNNGGAFQQGSSKQISMFFAGSGLTTGDITNFTNRFEAYMDSNGKGIIP